MPGLTFQFASFQTPAFVAMKLALSLLLGLVGVASAATDCTNEELISLSQAYDSESQVNCTLYSGELGSCVPAECSDYREDLVTSTPACLFGDRNLKTIALSFTPLPSCEEGSNLVEGDIIGSGSSGDVDVGSSGELVRCSDPSVAADGDFGFVQYQTAINDESICKHTDAHKVLQGGDCSNATTMMCFQHMANMLVMLTDCAIGSVNIVDNYALRLAVCAGKELSLNASLDNSASQGSDNASPPTRSAAAVALVVAFTGLVLVAM